MIIYNVNYQTIICLCIIFNNSVYCTSSNYYILYGTSFASGVRSLAEARTTTTTTTATTTATTATTTATTTTTTTTATAATTTLLYTTIHYY